jgi:hypothetical protein
MSRQESLIESAGAERTLTFLLRPGIRPVHYRKSCLNKTAHSVTKTDYHFDQEIYGSRHEPREGPSRALRIERYVLEHYPLFIVTYHLDSLRVAATIQADPHKRMVVRQKGPSVVLEEVAEQYNPRGEGRQTRYPRMLSLDNW